MKTIEKIIEMRKNIIVIHPMAPSFVIHAIALSLVIPRTLLARNPVALNYDLLNSLCFKLLLAFSCSALLTSCSPVNSVEPFDARQADILIRESWIIHPTKTKTQTVQTTKNANKSN
jgi:hypothetical protein